MPPLDPKSIEVLSRLTGLKKLEDNSDGASERTKASPSAVGDSGHAGPAVQIKTPDHPFHNPYHFVPIAKLDENEKEHWISVADFRDSKKKHHYTHSRYVDGKFSGRMICRLTNEDPFFIGNESEKNGAKDKPKKIFPFELEKGRPAIPASSLRGLLSIIVEAASNSSMRVLTDGILSFRKSMNPKEVLSALGMVVMKDGNYWLRPLSVPTLEGNQKKGYVLGKNFRIIFTKPRLKVYVGDYSNRSDTFLNGKETSTNQKKEYYYLKLKKDWEFDSGVLQNNKLLRNPRGGTNPSFVIGQCPIDNAAPLTEEAYRDIADETIKKQYVRGILRVLGKAGRADIPNGKKHELFIPYPEGAEKWDLIEIEDDAVTRFNLLADERTRATVNKKYEQTKENLLPYEPLGTARNDAKVGDNKNLRLKDGDIVYFGVGSNNKIDEVSFSSIWRDCVREGSSPATVHSFFERIDRELLPFNKNRKWISPAELLFGFVQEDKDKTGNKENEKASGGLALAGRVRVSFGKLKEDVKGPFYEGEVSLKILGTPKPPCPSMYFKNKDNTAKYIQKSSLSLGKHEPQGRKVYLHRYEKDNEPWRTLLEAPDPDQQVRITPVKQGHEFYFHVDFNNLSSWELGLLCYAVRPSDAFRHKIGMGKSIGLGKVRIDPLGIFFIDRKSRYESDNLSSASRYHSAWVADNACPEVWPQAHKTEIGYAGREDMKKNENDFEMLRASFADTMNKKTGNALELLGDPAKVRYPVHTPQLIGGDIEKETYRWFVTNDKGSVREGHQNIPVCQQALKPLNDDKDMPVLGRHPWKR